MNKYGIPFEEPHLDQVYVFSYFDENYEGGSNREHTFTQKEQEEKAYPEPNSVSSEMVFRDARQNTWHNEDIMHRPILDIDFPIYAIPSSTPGHYHLYIDKPMSKSDYMKLLATLAEVGIIEQGYYNASRMRGYTMVRLPGVKKEESKRLFQDYSEKRD